MEELKGFIKFEPILKEKIWGGSKLMERFNKKSHKNNIGESWEISDLDKDISVVSNGTFKGRDLRSLISEYKSSLVGGRVYTIFKGEFPLLIKFIDAKEILSLQVHPDDIMAKERHNSFGKTEVWYILEAESDSNIIIGFSEETDKMSFKNLLSQGKELDVLNIDFVKKGDTYLVPAGRVHAIGKGVLLAEIQETSDITYRVSDWGRVDAEGSSRDTHVELALEALDYSSKSNYKSEYFRVKNSPTNIVDCKYFTTNFIHLTETCKINHFDKDSFVVYICVEGNVQFMNNDVSESLKKGETLLVPASLKEFVIMPLSKSELLEVYININFY